MQETSKTDGVVQSMTGAEEAPAGLFAFDTPVTPPPQPKSSSKHYHGHRNRLRQKLIEGMDQCLADYELLELLLFAFIPRRDVKPIAKALMARFGGVSGVMAAPVNRLVEVDGVGENVAAYIKATHFLHRAALMEELQQRPIISSWHVLQDYLKLTLQHETKEQFRVLFLDRKNQLIVDEKQSSGTVDHAPVYPRELARRALELAASSLILVHNHPSGDPTPSNADITITREIIDALDALEITVHDHLIVGKNRTASFKTLGLI